MSEYKGTAALDAGLIAAAQAVEHYEIIPLRNTKVLGYQAWYEAGSNTARSDAERGKKTDETLSSIAETAVNAEAA
jgi:ferritin-like metal-binding protein YciE